MNNTILTDNKEIETLDLPSWWSDDFPCVATLLKTGFKGHRQLFAADVDVLPGVGFTPGEIAEVTEIPDKDLKPEAVE